MFLYYFSYFSFSFFFLFLLKHNFYKCHLVIQAFSICGTVPIEEIGLRGPPFQFWKIYSTNSPCAWAPETQRFCEFYKQKSSCRQHWISSYVFVFLSFETGVQLFFYKLCVRHLFFRNCRSRQENCHSVLEGTEWRVPFIEIVRRWSCRKKYYGPPGWAHNAPRDTANTSRQTARPPGRSPGSMLWSRLKGFDLNRRASALRHPAIEQDADMEIMWMVLTPQHLTLCTHTVLCEWHVRKLCIQLQRQQIY